MSIFPRRTRPRLWMLWFLNVSMWMSGSIADNKPADTKGDEGHNRTCYFPTGLPSPGKPCHPNQKQSGCCSPGFSCLSNGVCQAGPADANEKPPLKYNMYRSGCTDQSFNDPACPQFCTGEDDNRAAGQGLKVCDAEKGTYCCRRDYECCTNSTITYNLGVGFIINTIPRPPAQPSHTTQAIAHSASSDSQTSFRGSSYARDTIIGAGAGFGAAFVIFIGGGCFWIVKRRRSRKRRKRDRMGSALELDAVDPAKLGSKDMSVSVTAVGESESEGPVELEHVPRHELEDRRSPVEEHVVRFELEAPHTPVERWTSTTQTLVERRPSASTERRPSIPISPVDIYHNARGERRPSIPFSLHEEDPVAQTVRRPSIPFSLNEEDLVAPTGRRPSIPYSPDDVNPIKPMERRPD